VKHQVLLALAAVLLCTFSFAAPKGTTYSGEIMDSECANSGSHAEMLKKEGLGDKHPSDRMAKKMCTAKCTKAGGKYVLYSAATKKVYALDDQTKPEQFAGQRVKVTGSLDQATETIHVTNIAPGS
jgi:Protein of unknown function (DUF5818)